MSNHSSSTAIAGHVIAANAGLSVVVPAYNEAEGLEPLYQRLKQALDGIDLPWEIVFVNDGSQDATGEVLKDLQSRDDRIAILELSRNFGKEIALTAGLDRAVGDAVVVIDADLQDPPELIPEMLARWRQGYDVVNARRTRRHGESMIKKATAAVFYRTMAQVGAVPIPADVGDYRLLSRRAVDALAQVRERHRFMKGLFAWIGFRQVSIDYVRDPRHAGNTKFNYWKLWNFAIEGFTSFTTAPLKLATYLGVTTALFAFAYGMVIVTKTFIYGKDIPGYASLMVTMLFLGGVQLVALGVLGEYIGRMFNEVKNRPLYLVDEFLPSSLPSAGVPDSLDTTSRQKAVR